MKISPLAGRPPPPAMLLDVSRLVTAYYTEIPDPVGACAARRLRHVGASRLGVRDGLQRMARARDQRSHLPLSPGAGHRRAALSRPRHARAVGAGLRDRARGAGGERCRRHARRARRIHADARGVARDPRLQPRAQDGAGRRDRDHAVPQSTRQRRLQVQPPRRGAGRHRRHRAGSKPGPTSSWSTVSTA